PFMLFLTALIFRAVAIEFRSKEPMRWWRKTWDRVYCGASILIAFLLGLVLGNLYLGLAIDENFEYQGGLWEMFNPYALFTGVTVVALFAMHGANYLIMKTEKRLHVKLILLAKQSSRFFVICYVILSLATLLYLPDKVAIFRSNPLLFIIPVLTILSIITTRRSVEKGRFFGAFLGSSITQMLLLITFAINLYPNLVVSTLDPTFSINVYNGAASAKSLGIMLGFAAVGIPIVATYTFFVFWTFRGKVKLDESSY
ncbi:MAG: cytochrome d ubiquinol oxidase subunit II, partial [Bacteroidota bacterium]